jgi:hypothetical protein
MGALSRLRYSSCFCALNALKAENAEMMVEYTKRVFVICAAQHYRLLL